MVDQNKNKIIYKFFMIYDSPFVRENRSIQKPRVKPVEITDLNRCKLTFKMSASVH